MSAAVRTQTAATAAVGAGAVQAFLLAVIADDELGDADAVSAVEQALERAQRDGAVLAFVLRPTPELLRRPAGECSHAALITEILRLLPRPRPARGEWTAGAGQLALVRDADGDGDAAAPGRPVEALTDCETRVLRYLPTNLSAPEIADQLSVSANTVRTHMRHVYEKLGAHRRAGAVDRARELGLLAPPSHAA